MFDDDPRWGSDPRERHDDARDRDPVDPRDTFTEHVDLPRGRERELVRDRDREYSNASYRLNTDYQRLLPEIRGASPPRPPLRAHSWGPNYRLSV
jgi:hypothetical protein